MAFLGAVCTVGDNSLPLYALLHVLWWCDIRWLVCVLFPCPPLLLLCMLGVGSSCMGTDAVNLFLHIIVSGWPGFWINHNLFCTMCAFVLVGRGWWWEVWCIFVDWFLVFVCWLCWFFFFFYLKQRSWDLLRGFPTSCFSVWYNLPIYPLPTPPKETGSFACVSLKQPAAWTIKNMENTQFVLPDKVVVGNTNSTCFFLPL